MTKAQRAERAAEHDRLKDLLKAPKAEDRIYLVVGPNCWGRGLTQEAATKAARVYCPVPRFRKWVVFYGHPSMYVDDMGSLCWFTEHGQPQRVSG